MFCVYNTRFGNENHLNTAWIKEEANGWMPVETDSQYAAKTALGIQALIRYKEESEIHPLPNLLNPSGFVFGKEF